jgi:hypothetical protein
MHDELAAFFPPPVQPSLTLSGGPGERMRQVRASGRGWAVAIALTLHAIVLTALMVGPRVTPPVELPTMQVTLARPLRWPPPAAAPKPRKPVLRRLDRVTPSEVPPLPVPPPPVNPPAPSADERWRLDAAPFGGEERVFKAIRLRKRCLDGERLTDWERSKCPVVKPLQPGEQTYTAIPKDKAAAFAQASQRKEAIRRYKETGVGFPGLHCSFGRAC